MQIKSKMKIKNCVKWNLEGGGVTAVDGFGWNVDAL